MNSNASALRDWIVSNTTTSLEVTEVGSFPTPEGEITLLDPLAFYQTPEWIKVPTSGGQIVVFHDTKHGRNSKLAIVFSDASVTGGDDVATCFVDAGMASIFTPATHAAQLDFANSLGENANLYKDYFHKFDDSAGGERKLATLPDGTVVPYIHSGWGDGAYPVFTLTDDQNRLVAVYTDFMGTGEDGLYLTPPGFVIPTD